MDSSSASNPPPPPPPAQALSPTYAVRTERERLLEAMVRNAAANGYEETAVGAVTETAGLSLETFAALFASKEECFLEAYDAVIDVVYAHVAGAYEEAEAQPWPDRVVAALRALSELLAAEADIAHLALVDVTAVGEDARLRYRTALGRFAPLLEAGRGYSTEVEEPPPDTAAFAIGGVTSMIFDELRAGRTAELPGMVPDLAFAALMPYLGAEGAEAEMRRVTAGGREG
jgi:AcrR family transcriptional regulator